MPTCPNGHQSAADDWCEVCGHRMTGAPAAPPASNGFAGPPPPPAPGGQGYAGQAPGSGYGYPGPQSAGGELCPQCGTPREAQAPFCEECRYNFLTHSPTAYAPPNPPQQGGFPPAGGQQPYPGQAQPLGYESSRPSQMNRPAEPLAPDQQNPYPQPGNPPQGPPVPQPAQPSGDWVLPPPSSPAQQPQQQPGEHPLHGYGQPGQGVEQQGPGMVPQQPGAPQPAAWLAVIGPDREYFTAMMGRSGPEAAALNLPAYSPEQQLPLTGHQVTIGRRRQSTGEAPDIDLGRPPEDPGVSHQHAVLVQQPDGSWSVVDQDSTNGTTINGSEDPIQPFIPVPLREGDRVHVGAWTTITLHHA